MTDRTAIYVHVAHVEDEASTSPALARQEQECRDFAKEHGLEVVSVVTEVGSGRRPEFLIDLIDKVTDGKIDGVIVSSVDRLGRDNAIAAAAISDLVEHGFLISVRENLDSRKAKDRRSLSVVSTHVVMAEVARGNRLRPRSAHHSK